MGLEFSSVLAEEMLSVGAPRLVVGGRPDPKLWHAGDPSRMMGALMGGLEC
jgi:hypothetical protein